MSEHTCYECENFFKSSFCGYDACRCKMHGSLDMDQHERHPDITGATCPDFAPKTKTWKVVPGFGGWMVLCFECPYCGKRVPDEPDTCPACGNRVKGNRW